MTRMTQMTHGFERGARASLRFRLVRHVRHLRHWEGEQR